MTGESEIINPNPGPTKLADFDFARIQLQEKPKEGREHWQPTAEAALSLRIDERDYTMLLTRKDYQKRTIFRFFVNEGDVPTDQEVAILDGALKFEFESSEYDGLDVVITYIKRDNEKKKLPPGIGIAIYKKMLDFIQHEATVYKKPLLHIASHESSFGLSKAKWNKIFVPIFTERQYHKVGRGKDETWKREYLPQESV